MGGKDAADRGDPDPMPEAEQLALGASHAQPGFSRASRSLEAGNPSLRRGRPGRYLDSESFGRRQILGRGNGTPPPAAWGRLRNFHLLCASFLTARKGRPTFVRPKESAHVSIV